MFRRILSNVKISPGKYLREFIIALALCLIVILLVIVTSDSAPEWIYQNF
jgi:hypothetical protein